MSFLLWLMEKWVICFSIFRGSLFAVDQSLMFTSSLFTTLKVWTSWKVSKYRVFSGPYFSVLGLNTEIYGVNLYSQSEYRKMRTRKTLYLDTFHARCLISLWLKKRLIYSASIIGSNKRDVFGRSLTCTRDKWSKSRSLGDGTSNIY